MANPSSGPKGAMDRCEIENYFALNVQERDLLGRCINGYGQNNPIGQLFYWISELASSFFGNSDWQKLERLFKSREYTKICADLEKTTPFKNKGLDLTVKKAASIASKAMARKILTHQIALRSSFSLFSPINRKQWVQGDWNNYHVKPTHEEIVEKLEKVRAFTPKK